MIKLLSWNVNGYRAIAAKRDWNWFSHTDADIIGLQETKVDPSQLTAEQLEPPGWHAFWQASQGKKG